MRPRPGRTSFIWTFRALPFLVVTSTLLLTGCSRFDLLNATVPSWSYCRSTNIAYGDQPRQKLDIYRPRNARPDAPVVVFFYGGSWQSGAKGDYRFVAQALTSRGFVVVVPDYRLYPTVTFPAFVEDAALAVRWAHENVAGAGGDPKQIHLMGHSAGAHIATLLTLDERYLQAVRLEMDVIKATASLSGPYDFEPSGDIRRVFGLVEGSEPAERSFLPIRFVDGTEPPILLIHGGKDETVEPGNILRLTAEIGKSGGTVRGLIYPKRGHVATVLSLAWPFRHLASVLDDVTQFFEEH